MIPRPATMRSAAPEGWAPSSNAIPHSNMMANNMFRKGCGRLLSRHCWSRVTRSTPYPRSSSMPTTLVVAVVVGIPLLRGDTGHVPLPGAGMDFRVVHPIPLTVAEVMAELVMAEFHVLDALGHGERGGSEHPAGLAAAGTDSESCGNLEASLKRDSALDVCPVIFTERILDVAADRLQLGSE